VGCRLNILGMPFYAIHVGAEKQLFLSGIQKQVILTATFSTFYFYQIPGLFELTTKLS